MDGWMGGWMDEKQKGTTRESREVGEDSNKKRGIN
jgi:hypothetical protein